MEGSTFVVSREDAPQNLGLNEGLRCCNAEHSEQVGLAKLPVFEAGGEFEHVEAFLIGKPQLRIWTKTL